MRQALSAPAQAAAILLAMAACGKGGEGEPLPSAPLTRTSWVLESVAGANVVQPGQATLTFDDAGQASGKGTCNRFSGNVTIDGDRISFGPLMATKMACVEPELMTQETSYLSALEAAERFTVAGDTLRIFVKGGAEPMRFLRTMSP